MPINSVIVDDGWGNDNIGVSDIYRLLRVF